MYIIGTNLSFVNGFLFLVDRKIKLCCNKITEYREKFLYILIIYTKFINRAWEAVDKSKRSV